MLRYNASLGSLRLSLFDMFNNENSKRKSFRNQNTRPMISNDQQSCLYILPKKTCYSFMLQKSLNQKLQISYYIEVLLFNFVMD